MDLEEYRREKAEHDFLEDMRLQSEKSFMIYIKSPFPDSDFEDQIKAISKEHAAHKFKEKYRRALIEFSEKDLLQFIEEE